MFRYCYRLHFSTVCVATSLSYVPMQRLVFLLDVSRSDGVDNYYRISERTISHAI